ncbi:MAG: cyclic 2,3-diphosphoglycerate synthase [Alphaproteobacteria bacterium]
MAMKTHTEPKRVLIMGAAGRDFHNFNVIFRDDPSVRVVAFTAAQLPGLADRRYPPALAGQFYPNGIPIEEESCLERIIHAQQVATVMFAYSDVTHAQVMHAASRAMAAGADFMLAGPATTMLRSVRPVIAISAVRTGCGKSQTAHYLSHHLRSRGTRVATLRHPMPYGDLSRQAVQRFASRADLDAADCTIEEREEYEPHIAAGGLVFAGVDYAKILKAAEQEADLILWEGGNNDFPFLCPDLHIVITDALRPEQLTSHHPGEAVLRMADIVVINKVDEAAPEAVQRMTAAIAALRPNTPIVHAASPVVLDNMEAARGRHVIVVEDGPTVTHGGMPYGAGYVALRAVPDVTIVDPRQSAEPLIAAVYEQYPHIGKVLPATGYSPEQCAALAATINQSEAEVVIAATPVDLVRILDLNKPVIRAQYSYQDASTPGLGTIVDQFLDQHGLQRRGQDGLSRPDKAG